MNILRYALRLVVSGLLLLPLLLRADVLQVAGDVNLLAAELNLMFFDPLNKDYEAAATSRYAVVESAMPVWLESLSAEQRAVAEPAWEELQLTLQGEDGYPGLLEGYDATLNARYTIAGDNLRELIMSQPALQRDVLPLKDYVWLMTTRAMGSYMSVAAAPFGSFALSADDDDTRLGRVVMELDQDWAALLEKAPEQDKPGLVRAHRRWQFIRQTLLNATQQSLPFIVSNQGEAILRELRGS